MEWLSSGGKKASSSKSTKQSKEEHKPDKPKKTRKLKDSPVVKRLSCGATMKPDLASMVICADDSFKEHLASCAKCKRKFDLQTQKGRRNLGKNKKKNEFLDLNEDLNEDDLTDLLR